MKLNLSRPELAMLAGAVLIVASIVGPACLWISKQRKVMRIRADMAALMTAGRQFYAEYGIWPCKHVEKSGDRHYGGSAPNREVINVLRSVTGPGNEDGSVNPNHAVFLELESYRPGHSGLNEKGDFLDPWGSPYQIVLDTDLNGACDIRDSTHGTGIVQGMVIWSCGPDERTDTPDDIVSWGR